MLIYGSSASGKTSLIKYYLSRVRSNHVVFGRDEKEFPASNVVPLLQLEKKVMNHLLKQRLYWMMQVHTKVLKQK